MTMSGWLGALASLAAVVFAGAAAAQSAGQADNNIHGRLELQDAGQVSKGDSIQAALGARDANDALASLRVTWSPTFGRWSLDVHDVISVEAGPPVAIARAEAGL